jgi:hypothetical protein
VQKCLETLDTFWSWNFWNIFKWKLS